MASNVQRCDPKDQVLELRVHGAGDTPLEELLGRGEYELVHGDDHTAGFYRLEGVDGLEAYSWGKFTHRKKSRAFWVLLAPFTLANLSGWLVDRDEEKKKQQTEDDAKDKTEAVKKLVRLLAVSMTTLLVMWLGAVAVDTAALQCGGQDLCADRHIWLRFFNLGFFDDEPARRLVVGLIVPLVIVLLLLIIAGWRNADAYERYQNEDAFVESSETKIASDPSVAGEQDHPLREGSLWRTFHYVRGMSLLHGAAALAGTSAAAAFGLWRIGNGGGGVGDFFGDFFTIDHAIVIGALLVVVLIALAVAQERVSKPGLTEDTGAASRNWRYLGGAIGILVIVVIRGLTGSFDGSGNIAKSYFGYTYLGLVLSTIVFVLLVVLLYYSWRYGRKDAAYDGYGPFVAMAFGLVITAVFAAGTLLWASDWLGDPPGDTRPGVAVVEATAELDEAVTVGVDGCSGLSGDEKTACEDEATRQTVDRYLLALDDARQPPIEIPSGFDLVAVSALFMLLVAAWRVGRLEWWLRRTKVPADDCPPAGSHAAMIAEAENRSDREVKGWRSAIAKDTRTSPRNTRLHRVVGWILWAAAIASIGLIIDFWLLGEFIIEPFEDWLEGGGSWLLTISRWVIVAAVVYAGVYVQRSYSNPTKRRAIGGVWDVATFWPRAFHPFAPPAYSARAVPELRARIKTWLADPKHRLVLSAHSQGVPLTMAVLTQLEPAELARVAYISHGSPTGALYGTFFPAYYGPKRVHQLGALLRNSTGQTIRWRNLWRITDWTGGYAFPPPRRHLDLSAVNCVDLNGTDPDKKADAQRTVYVDLREKIAAAAEGDKQELRAVLDMAQEVEVLWCDPHHDATFTHLDPLPASEGHHTYLTDARYRDVCTELTALLP